MTESDQGELRVATTVQCPDGHTNQGTRSLCGVCGKQLPFPAEWRKQGLKLSTMSKAALIGGAIVLLGVGIAFKIGSNSGNDSKRWSGYPHAMGCEVTPPDEEQRSADEELRSAGLSVPTPSSALVEQVTLTHLDGDRLQVSLEFQESAPPSPSWIVSPYSGNRIHAPGSISYTVSVSREGTDGGVNILSPSDGHGWLGTQMQYVVNDIIGETNPDSYDGNRNLVQTASVNGKTVIITLDLSGVPGLFGHGPFRPDVGVGVMVHGRPTSELPDGLLQVADPQSCAWSQMRSSRPEPHSGANAGSQPTPPAPTGTWQGNPIPVPQERNLHWQFRSPTGNIVCDLDGGTGQGIASCEIREHTYRPQVIPDCRPDWLNTFTLKQGRPVAPSCSPRTAFPNGLPTQQYGNPLTVGTITCTIFEDTGVACTDSTTGHYFRASTQSYEWR